ncbi:hypothetical protein [Bacillus cereus]|nr:hypothetical protein [Bacillus cereus]
MNLVKFLLVLVPLQLNIEFVEWREFVEEAVAMVSVSVVIFDLL